MGLWVQGQQITVVEHVRGQRTQLVIGAIAPMYACGLGEAGDGFDPVGQCRQRTGHERTRSEEHTAELQSLMRISYAVFCLKNNRPYCTDNTTTHITATT